MFSSSKYSLFHNSNVFGSYLIHILYTGCAKIKRNNSGVKYFKHVIYSPFFPLQNAVCFIILTYLVPVLFIFYIQGVLKLKKNSGIKRLMIPRPKSVPLTSQSQSTIHNQQSTHLAHFLLYLPVSSQLMSLLLLQKFPLPAGNSKCQYAVSAI